MTDSLPRSGAAPMTAPLKLASGSASSPALSFNAANGTGVYSTGTGLGVAVNGVKVGEFTSGGLTQGSHYIGELIPWTGRNPPAKCVFPVGQTLSRTTYADLWTFAQSEIAAGNLFYNNGDGATTFGIGDLRGRTIASPDIMGGSADANRLSSSAIAAQRNSVGGVGGEGAHLLSASEIPSINSSGANTISVSGSTTSSVVVGIGSAGVQGGGNFVNLVTAFNQAGVSASGNNTINVSSSNTGGLSHNNMQPTILCNYALYAGA